MATKGIRPRGVGLLLAASLLAAACVAQTAGQATNSESAATVPGAATTASEQASAAAPLSPSLRWQCPYTLPPDRGPIPVAGISIRSTDRAHVEIANATGRPYYYRVRAWFVEELDCGLGLTSRDEAGGPVAAGETVVLWVSQNAPITIEVWDRPCGEGCVRQPVGITVVPMSSLEPPQPQIT